MLLNGRRWIAFRFLEHFAEIGKILKAAGFGGFRHGNAAGHQHDFSVIHAYPLQVFLVGRTGILLNSFPK